MKVTVKPATEREKPTRVFELTLTREELEDLDSGCDRTQYLQGYISPGGEPLGFYLFPNINPDGRETFRPMHSVGNVSGYGIEIGAIRRGNDFESWSPDDLKREFERRNRIPIQDGKTNLGYVVIKVEEESAEARAQERPQE